MSTRSVYADNITAIRELAAKLVHASGTTNECRHFLTWFRWSDLPRSICMYVYLEYVRNVKSFSSPF